MYKRQVLGVAGAARDHYMLLIFGLVLSIVLMATAATLISGWIKKYKWIGWVGLLAILFVANKWTQINRRFVITIHYLQTLC